MSCFPLFVSGRTAGYAMTIIQMVQNQQQQWIGKISQRTQNKPLVNPYGTLGMSLNDMSDY